jgi:hypothetical protein
VTGTEIAFLAISAAMATASTVVQAQSQASSARYNAKVAEQNAEAARRQAEAGAERQGRQNQRELAKRRTAYAAAGVSLEGSPLDLLEDVAIEGQMDVLGIRQRGLEQARQYAIAAEKSRHEASTTETLGTLGAIQTGAARLSPKVDDYLKGLEKPKASGNDFTGYYNEA